MVAEMCPWRELQPRAFSVMPLVYNIGSVLGPAFGGALSNPLHRRPKDVERSGGPLLLRFPYALPNIIAAAFFLVGITVGTLFLKETLASQKDKPDYGLILGQKIKAMIRENFSTFKTILRSQRGRQDDEEPLLGNSSTPYTATIIKDEETAIDKPDTEENEKKPTYSEVLTKQTLLNLLVYTLLAMHAIAFDQLLPVFMHHPRQGRGIVETKLPLRFNKGFGVDSSRIGLIFTFYGVMGIFNQFVLFPPLARRYGVLKCFRVVAHVMPLVYILAPFSTLVPNVVGAEVTLFLLWLVKGVCTTFAFPCTTILLTNTAPSLKVLGTINGIATSVSAIGRAAGPTLGGAVFTWGAKEGYIIAPFWTLACVAALATLPTWWLVEGDGFGNDDDDDDSEDLVGEEGRGQGSAYEPSREGNAEGRAAAEAFDSVSPLLSRESSFSRGLYHVGSRTSNAMTETDSEFEDPDDDVEVDTSEPLLSAYASRRDSDVRRGATSMRRRRSSVPIGMGPGFRRMSSNLGTSRSGFGNGAGIGGA